MTLGDAYSGKLPIDNARIGFACYNDLTTTTTKIVVTGVGGDVVLTNDAAGPQTIETFLPIGVTSLWDEVTNNFDWSMLRLGDMVDIRLDIDIITTLPNTEVHIELNLGTGGGAFVIPFISGLDFKVANTHKVTRFSGIYIGNANVRDNGGQFKIRSDKDCTVQVNGWYCKVLLRG